MGHFGLTEVLTILLIGVMLLGAVKLPEIGGALGQGLRDLRSASREDTGLLAGPQKK
ncbi:MAG: twin-arginine translocase TatA/TatE family subunit [Anaerolineae bacterium]|jgi:sec-independent protein translocase protein TatA|nr:twin-arginine translocase TatA/TatE family subunit [Chloroflexota bacterium]